MIDWLYTKFSSLPMRNLLNYIKWNVIELQPRNEFIKIMDDDSQFSRSQGQKNVQWYHHSTHLQQKSGIWVKSLRVLIFWILWQLFTEGLRSLTSFRNVARISIKFQLVFNKREWSIKLNTFLKVLHHCTEA